MCFENDAQIEEPECLGQMKRRKRRRMSINQWRRLRGPPNVKAVALKDAKFVVLRRRYLAATGATPSQDSFAPIVLLLVVHFQRSAYSVKNCSAQSQFRFRPLFKRPKLDVLLYAAFYIYPTSSSINCINVSQNWTKWRRCRWRTTRIPSCDRGWQVTALHLTPYSMHLTNNPIEQVPYPTPPPALHRALLLIFALHNTIPSTLWISILSLKPDLSLNVPFVFPTRLLTNKATSSLLSSSVISMCVSNHRPILVILGSADLACCKT